MAEEGGDEEDELVGEKLGGRYRVVRLVQRGGMGAVYEAVQEPLGRRVAIKVLHAHLAGDEVSMERFRREAEATARLHHPHIVQVTDYQATPGEPAFLVMELLTGRSLAEAMREDGIFAPERAVHVAVQVLDALGAAHEAGVVHRDLKPTNVLLGSSAGLRDVVTIFDFGIAKLVEVAYGERGRLTMEGAVVGTPAYMSPEQARGKEIDARADLYALGVLLYAMLAGRLPYGSREPGMILKAVVTEPPTPLAEVRPDVDPDLAEVVERALAKEPDGRWQTAEEMRRALQRWQRRVGATEAERVSEAPGAAAVTGTGTETGTATDHGGRIAGDGSDATGAERRRRGGLGPWAVVGGLAGAAALGAALMYLARPATERVVVLPVASGATAADGRVEADPSPVVPAPVAVSDAGVAREAVTATPPTSVERPRHATPTSPGAGTARRSGLRVQGAAADTLYDPLELTAKLDAIGGTLDTCLLGQDIPAGSAPPVWHLAVTPEGQVRSVRSAVGEWPIAAVNCVTRALTDVHLGATRSHDGGQLVLTFGPR